MANPYTGFSDRPVRSLIQLLQEGLQTLVQLLLLGLLIVGLGGFVYSALRPEGWLEAVLKPLWNAYPTVAIGVGIALLIACGWARNVFERLPMFGRRADWLMYGCLAFGVYFCGRLLLSGG